MKTKLIFATGNQNKVKEVLNLLPDHIEIQSLKEIGFTDDIPETSPLIEGNARLKVDAIYEMYQENVFAEDTGLEVEALNGEPGVRSARYAGKEKESDANMNLVLENLKSKENRAARFKTVIGLYWKDNYYAFEGILNGTILHEKRGSHGFGYDPIFQPSGFEKTLAEMTSEEKNKISHRGKAVRKLVQFLKEQV